VGGPFRNHGGRFPADLPEELLGGPSTPSCATLAADTSVSPLTAEYAKAVAVEPGEAWAALLVGVLPCQPLTSKAGRRWGIRILAALLGSYGPMTRSSTGGGRSDEPEELAATPMDRTLASRSSWRAMLASRMRRWRS